MNKHYLKEFTKAIKIDPEYLEAYYFIEYLALVWKLYGSSIDARACRDIKKANKNNFPEAFRVCKSK